MTAIFWKHGASGAWSNGAEWSDAANPGAADASAFATPLLSAGLAEAPASAGPLVTNDSWAGAVSGDWSKAADWTAGVPTASTAATVAAAGSYTVNVTSPDMANSLLINRAGATVDDTGTLSIGTSLKISAGTFVLDAGGSLVGGTVSLASGGAFVVQAGTLSGVTYDGTLSTNGYDLHLAGADSFAGSGGTGAGTINLASDDLYAEGTTTLSGATVANFGSAIYADADDVHTAATLTLASTTNIVTVVGGLEEIDLYDYSSSYSGTLVNKGTITCTNSEGNSLSIYGKASDVFLNQGKVSVNGGGILNLLTNVTGAGGTFAVASGGTLMLHGGETINNAGGTLSIASGGQFDLNGTVSGGTIVDTSGGLASSGGLLNGVSFYGTLNVAYPETVSFLGTERFAGSAGTGLGVINFTSEDSALYAVGSTTISGATLNFGNAASANTLYLDGKDSGSNATLRACQGITERSFLF